MGDVAGHCPHLLQQVIRQYAVRPGSERQVRGINNVEVHDRRVVVGRLDPLHLVPAAGRNQWRRVLVAVLQPPEFKRRPNVLRRKGHPVMPLDAAAQLPGDVHLVAAHLDASVFEGGNLHGQLRHPVVGQLGIVRQRVLVGLHGQQPLHGGVDVGAGMRGSRRDIAGEEAILLLP